MHNAGNINPLLWYEDVIEESQTRTSQKKVYLSSAFLLNTKFIFRIGLIIYKYLDQYDTSLPLYNVNYQQQ
jgi:hypothetical protein